MVLSGWRVRACAQVADHHYRYPSMKWAGDINTKGKTDTMVFGCLWKIGSQRVFAGRAGRRWLVGRADVG